MNFTFVIECSNFITLLKSVLNKLKTVDFGCRFGEDRRPIVWHAVSDKWSFLRHFRNVAERKLLVLLSCVETEKFSVEVEHREDKNDWRVYAQLAAVP